MGFDKHLSMEREELKELLDDLAFNDSDDIWIVNATVWTEDGIREIRDELIKEKGLEIETGYNIRVIDILKDIDSDEQFPARHIMEFLRGMRDGGTVIVLDFYAIEGHEAGVLWGSLIEIASQTNIRLYIVNRER